MFAFKCVVYFIAVFIYVQELFEERRRGKTLSQSESTIIPEVSGA